MCLHLLAGCERHGAYRTLEVIFDNFAETLRNVFAVALLFEEDLFAALANRQCVGTFRLNFASRKVKRLMDGLDENVQKLFINICMKRIYNDWNQFKNKSES